MYLTPIFLFWWIFHVQLQQNVCSIVVGYGSLKRSIRSKLFHSEVQVFYIPTDFLSICSVNYVISGKRVDFFIFPFISEKILLHIFWSSVIILACMLGILTPCWWMHSRGIMKCLSLTSQILCPEIYFSGINIAIKLSYLLLAWHIFFHLDSFIKLSVSLQLKCVSYKQHIT